MKKKETKTYRAPLNFKGDEKPGEFEAVFATLNVIDHDQDVTLPGAFGEQRVLIEPWNYNYQAPPVGKGRIFEKDDEAIVDGRFFLDTPAGEEHYKVAKELDDMQEFSYTFNIIEADFGTFEGQEVRFLKKMDVWGVGQVTRGAGIDTRLTAIKGAGNGVDDDPESNDEDETGNGKLNASDPETNINLLEIQTIVARATHGQGEQDE